MHDAMYVANNLTENVDAICDIKDLIQKTNAKCDIDELI